MYIGMILNVIQFDVTRAVVFRDARTGPHLTSVAWKYNHSEHVPYIPCFCAFLMYHFYFKLRLQENDVCLYVHVYTNSV